MDKSMMRRLYAADKTAEDKNHHDENDEQISFLEDSLHHHKTGSEMLAAKLK